MMSHQRQITGILTHAPEQKVYHNSAVVLSGEERLFYHKRHLVPFGEHFPVPDFVREWLRLMNLPYSDFEEGECSNALEIKPDVTAATLNCYKVAFGGEAMDAMPVAGFIINISNDGWFGESIGPKQHFQMTSMRAKEAVRPLVRVTNTGVSALVFPSGEKKSIFSGIKIVNTDDIQPRWNRFFASVDISLIPQLVVVLTLLGIRLDFVNHDKHSS